VDVAGACDERHRVPGDRGVLRGIEAHGTVERLVVFDVELQFQAGEIGLRQVLQAQMVVIVVSVPEAQHREVLRSLKDPGDRDPGLGGVVERSGSGAPCEALQLEVAARVEDVERIGGQE
jgi:hypothetical protein